MDKEDNNHNSESLNSEIEKGFAVLKKFADKFIQNLEDIPRSFADVINKDFWKLF
uniref:Uncharacterized protein n=1 Tax=viral metagenome TaxID=1070528 RepID=A0A6M3JJQ3_9ZZZZ